MRCRLDSKKKDEVLDVYDWEDVTETGIPCAFCGRTSAEHTHSERYSWNQIPIRFWYRLCLLCETAQREGWFKKWRWARKGDALLRMIRRVEGEG